MRWPDWVYKDERYLRLRRRLQERDKKCRVRFCNVVLTEPHHLYYITGEYLYPWQYPDAAYLLFCRLHHDLAPRNNYLAGHPNNLALKLMAFTTIVIVESLAIKDDRQLELELELELLRK